MKSVLLVDDERPFLMSLKEGLLSSGKRLRVLTAHDGREAIDVLSRTEVDLVVTDLNMPEVDGMALLAHMSQAHPRIPVIVMTAYGSPNAEERVSSMGAMRYCEKPIDFKELSSAVFEFLSMPTSYIRGITLSSFVQLIHVERKTCVVRATSAEVPPRTGLLFFEDGELVHASEGDRGGLQAAYEILAWDSAALELEESHGAVERTITLPLANVVMQSLVINDEKVAEGDDGQPVDQAGDVPPIATGAEGGEDDVAPFDAVFDHLQGTVPAIEAMVVVDRNGMPIFGRVPPTWDARGITCERLGKLATGLLGMAEAAGGGAGKGTLRRVTVEVEGGPLVAAPVNEDAYLVVLAASGVRLGLLYLGVDVALRSLSGVLLVYGCRG